MKKITLVCLVAIAACTMRMPDNMKAESAVRRFLDSVYNHKSVQIVEFKGFITMKEYHEQLKQDIYKSNKNYNGMSEVDKQKFREKVEAILSSGGASRLKGSKIICIYKADGRTHNTVFLIDPAFKNVYSTISETTLSSPPVY